MAKKTVFRLPELNQAAMNVKAMKQEQSANKATSGGLMAG